MADSVPGETLSLADDLTLSRMGYGAMQLAGPEVWGPPRDVDAAVAVLRAAIASGVNHIDTAGFYFSSLRSANELINTALAPYPDELVIATKVGPRRDPSGEWLAQATPAQLRGQVEENLRQLGRDYLDVVNLRRMRQESIAEHFGVLADLRDAGLIRHLGLSTVSPGQLAEAQQIAPVACVQNFYNIAHRADDALIDSLAEQGVAYVPYFPLGGFTPLQSDALASVASRLEATPMAVALTWLLQRAPNILLIPGTSSVAHLRENLSAAELDLPGAALASLDKIAA